MNNTHLAIYLYDPAILNEWGGPTYVLVTGVALNRPASDILNSNNPNAALEAAITRVLDDTDAAQPNVQQHSIPSRKRGL